MVGENNKGTPKMQNNKEKKYEQSNEANRSIATTIVFAKLEKK